MSRLCPTLPHGLAHSVELPIQVPKGAQDDMSRFRAVFVAVATLTLVVSQVTIVQATTITEYNVSPAATHFPQNKQNESPMAVNPTDPLNAISGGNDEIQEPNCTPATGDPSSCPFGATVDTDGVYVTTNGGTSWTQTILNWYPAYGFTSDGDPAVAFGPKPDGNGGFAFTNGARAYAGSLASVPFGSPDQLLIGVARSDDKGVTWSGPVVATSRDNKVSGNDKEAIWADKETGSPYFGNVYVSWTGFRGTGNFGSAPTYEPEPIMFARSTDGGLTWSKAVQISSAFNTFPVGGRQGSTIRTDADGNVYVFWDGSLKLRSTVMGAKSTNGGKTFGTPFLVSYKDDNPSPLPGASFRDNSFPQADASGNSLYVTWTDYDADAGHGVVKLAKSTNGGASWTLSTAADVSGRSPFYPAVAVRGSNVFIGFNAIDDVDAGTAPGAGVVFYDAYYVYSTNGGANFASAVKISATPSDPDAATTNGLTAQFIGDYNGAAAGSDGNFWFSWTDTRNGATCSAIDNWRAGTAAKPNIYDSCPSAFGNSDIYVAKITP